ncbi:hypothetical protein JR316_0001698 [Psilocybe cubensis]|uniref:Uncharacterized protein n=1 Tax=Psilocybe cubensis TaxID=181762 RepID=A0ACB8HBE2_PSICU|nr:hypothetical protein JR316_0001698 [Psilocybe cubensis]KAH9484796.1 hypothetical protein JR316_0001698 [Psilocybe cubensis]
MSRRSRTIPIVVPALPGFNIRPKNTHQPKPQELSVDFGSLYFSSKPYHSMAITNSKNPLLLPNLSITTHPTTHISSYLQLPALSMYSGYSANQSLTNIPFIADGGSNHSARFPDLSSPPVTNQQQQQYGG